MRTSWSISATLPRIRPIWLLWQAYHKFLTDDALQMAAAIAYNALFSIFPLLLGVVALVGLYVDPVEVRTAITRTLSEYLPPETVRFITRNVTETIEARGTFTIFAIIGLFWAATAAAANIRHTLNLILGIAEPRPLLWRKLTELLFVAMAGAFMILSLITSEAVLGLASLYPETADFIDSLRQSATGQIASTLTPFLFSLLTFMVIYRYLPNVKIPFWNAFWGAVVTAILFELLKRGFFWYLQSFSRYHLVYGSITGIIVFLVWMYLSAAVLLYGAELANQVGRPYPQEMGE